MGTRPPLHRELLAMLVPLGLTAILLLPICGAVHRCGCVAPWAGASARCNVHSSSAAHCPWCEHAGLGAAGILLTLAGEGLVYARTRRRHGPWRAALAAAVALPVAMGLAAVLTWLPSDYPHLFVTDARSRLGLPPGPIRCCGPLSP
jgi:hypothetical protein